MRCRINCHIQHEGWVQRSLFVRDKSTKKKKEKKYSWISGPHTHILSSKFKMHHKYETCSTQKGLAADTAGNSWPYCSGMETRPRQMCSPTRRAWNHSGSVNLEVFHFPMNYPRFKPCFPKCNQDVLLLRLNYAASRICSMSGGVSLCTQVI